MRLDSYLVEKGLVNSKARSQILIELERVFVNGKVITKNSYSVSEADEIKVSPIPYVSVGAFKLIKALDYFGIDLNGKRCLDVGCSTGGFTQVMLERGAENVLAVDVDVSSLSESLVSNERVRTLDNANARDLCKLINEEFDFIAIDVSFIPLELVLPSVLPLMKSTGKMVALIKPQFEVGKKNLTKKGIVTDKKALQSAIKSVSDKVLQEGYIPVATIEIDKLFSNKNTEYLLLIKKL